MRYAEIYCRLIARSADRKPHGRVERHHVVPKCLGGGNERSNIAELTPREHYIAHVLLAKMHPSVPGLSYAVLMMGGKVQRLTSRTYAVAKAIAAADMSRRSKGVPRPRSAVEAMLAATKGRPKSEQTKAKLSAARQGAHVTAETKEKIARAMRGRVPSAATRALLSEARLGKPNPKALGNKSRTGMPNSALTRARIAEANRGKKHSPEWSLAISKGSAGLPDDVIRRIRAEYAQGSVSQDKLAVKYGLGQSHISRIILRRTYHWVE